MIGESLLRFDKVQKYLTIDTETTGLNLIYGLPFQVSFVSYTLDNDLEEHNYYVWWDNLQISKDAARITRFNYHDYKKNARPAKEILGIVDSYLLSNEYKVAAHNFIGYDSMIINSWRRKLGLETSYDYLYEQFKVYDTLALSKAYKKQIKPDISSSDTFLGFQFKMLSLIERGLKTNLTAMCKELKIEADYDNAHDGLFDCRINRELWRKLVWALEV